MAAPIPTTDPTLVPAPAPTSSLTLLPGNVFTTDFYPGGTQEPREKGGGNRKPKRGVDIELWPGRGGF